MMYSERRWLEAFDLWRVVLRFHIFEVNHDPVTFRNPLLQAALRHENLRLSISEHLLETVSRELQDPSAHNMRRI